MRKRLVDLSHTVTEGMTTYRGIDPPTISDLLSREASKKNYSEGTSFQIGKITLAANTGTYIDSPFHRFEDGEDLSQLALEQLADLPGVLVRVQNTNSRAIGRDIFSNVDVRAKAVLVRTDWARHWGTEQYFEGHPFLTEAAAVHLRDAGAVLVGIDTYNIDDTADRRRPVHTTLLRAKIPIVEHMCNLEALTARQFFFSAVPVKIAGMGSFPVRAYARWEE